jgi:simple sugar transport system ATP-binding protein
MSLLALEGLTKAYPGVVANSGISFSVEPGEIHALLGENGAGKSTLVKTIYGLVRPDSGSMTLGGERYAPARPSEARRAGVAMVFQHFSLFEAMNVAENVALGMDQAPKTAVLSQQIAAISRDYGLPIDPGRLIGDLSAGERQRVEILRCLLQSPRLLIMDEPTSVLTPQEVGVLFATLRKLRTEGIAILYISHKLEEIRVLCDRATILRGGKVVATCSPRDESARSLAEMMIGESLGAPPERHFAPGPVVLELKGLNRASEAAFGTSLKEVNLTLRAGEILGLAGVAGNGQDELMLALSGELVSPPGSVLLCGRDVSQDGPLARRAAGLCAAPEERLGHAAAPAMSLTENAFLTGHVREKLTRRGMIRHAGARSFAGNIIRAFDVRTPGPEVLARALSGGNLQKFVIGREILQRPLVLAVNQPTWGVDAAAAAAIRRALRQLAEGGAGVLVISQDLDELMEIADTFAVLAGGRLSPPRPVAEADAESIGRMMGGAHAA